MRETLRVVVAMVLVLVLLSCAGTRGIDANQSRFARDVGVATATEAYAKSMKVVNTYQFQVERESQQPQLYIETRWRDRAPFQDEQALGVGSAQIRMIVWATPRSGSSQGQLYNVNVRVESRVQLLNSADWSEALATQEYRLYAQRIADDLRRELDVGVRRY